MTAIDVVFCPECGKALGSGNPFSAVAAHRPYCTATTERRNKGIMSEATSGLRAVPNQAPKRPHPRDLLNHPSKPVARAAKKVVDAVAVLDQAWADDAGKAELRAKRERLKKELAKVEAELRGGTTAPGRDWKQIRAWAAEQGIDCPATGKVPNAVADAYEAQK